MLQFNYFDRDECKGSDVFTCSIDETHYDEMIELLESLIATFGEPDGVQWGITVERWFNNNGQITPYSKLVTISSTNEDISVYIRLIS